MSHQAGGPCAIPSAPPSVSLARSLTWFEVVEDRLGDEDAVVDDVQRLQALEKVLVFSKLQANPIRGEKKASLNQQSHLGRQMTE